MKIVYTENAYTVTLDEIIKALIIAGHPLLASNDSGPYKVSRPTIYGFINFDGRTVVLTDDVKLVWKTETEYPNLGA